MKCLKVVLSALVIAVCVLAVSSANPDCKTIFRASADPTKSEMADLNECKACIPGYKGDPSGKTPCTPDETSCKAGTNMFWKSNSCPCYPGFVRGPSGSCDPDATECATAKNMTHTAASCDCSVGYVRFENNDMNCIKKLTPKDCDYSKTNKLPNADGNKCSECRYGFIPDGTDKCKLNDKLDATACGKLGRKYDTSANVCKPECADATHKVANGHPAGRCFAKLADDAKCERSNRDKVDGHCLCMQDGLPRQMTHTQRTRIATVEQ